MADEELNKRKRELLKKYNEQSNRIVRESVETALFYLMEEKEFGAITITDIVKRAGVSRSAYYRNYTSKEEILSKIFDHSVDTIMGALRPALIEVRARDVYYNLFTAVQRETRLFEIILKANLEWTFISEVNQRLIQKISDTKIDERYRLYSWIGSTVNILLAWISSGRKESPEQMADICSIEYEPFLVPYLY